MAVSAKRSSRSLPTFIHNQVITSVRPKVRFRLRPSSRSVSVSAENSVSVRHYSDTSMYASAQWSRSPGARSFLCVLMAVM